MHKIFSKYLSDSGFAELCSDKALIQKMIDVEITLAKAQAQLSIIPKPEAEEITRVLSDISIDVELLSESVIQNGIPTIGFLAQAKQQLSPKASDYLHFGITSQDVTDTALVLILKEVLTEINRLLKTIISNFSSLSEKHKNTYLSARTRNQMAVPISFSNKVNGWKQPLERYLSKVENLKNNLPLQLAGTDGNLSVIDHQVEALVNEVAQYLDLKVTKGWHSQRDGLTELSDTLSGLCASMGKIGTDVLTLSQTEVGELLESSSSGGSSSMPHKKNPVRSEALVALATYAVNISAILKQAQIHKNERDGIALSLEWLCWPKLITTVGTCLKHSHFLSENIQVNTDRMKNNIQNQKGLIFSEKATYILAQYVGKTEAKSLVHQAIQRVVKENIDFAKALQNLTSEFNINWNSELLKN